MKITDDEMALANKWFEDRKKQLSYINTCKALFKEFKAGKLVELTPIWHSSVDKIDLKSQPHQLDEELLVEGFSFIPNVDMEDLLQSFQKAFTPFIRDKKIFNSKGFVDTQTCRIIEEWLSGKPLIPPLIIMNTLLDETYPADGKHRLKIAYYLGAKTLPIIVPNIHKERVLELITKSN